MTRFFSMNPESEGDDTPHGQRPLSVLLVVHRLLGRWMPDTPPFWIEETVVSCRGAADGLHIFHADVVKSSDTVDCAMVRLPGWCRKISFGCHALVTLRVKLAAGLDVAWTRDNVAFSKAASSWLRFEGLAAFPSSRCLCDNLKCTSSESAAFHLAAQFATRVSSGPVKRLPSLKVRPGW